MNEGGLGSRQVNESKLSVYLLQRAGYNLLWLSVGYSLREAAKYINAVMLKMLERENA